MTSDHFKGKTVQEHLQEAGSQSEHTTEMPEPLAAFTASLRETSFLLIAIWLAAHHLLTQHQAFLLLAFTACGWLLWRAGRVAVFAYLRLERIHQMVDEERREIELHPEQERQELEALYRAKGLQGPLLNQVLDVFMEDQQRLLRIMLQEELGVKVHSVEHPLKQGLGASLGVLLASSLCLLALHLTSQVGLLVLGAVLIALASLFSTKWDRARSAPYLVWNLSIAALTWSTLYWLSEFCGHL